MPRAYPYRPYYHHYRPYYYRPYYWPYSYYPAFYAGFYWGGWYPWYYGFYPPFPYYGYPYPYNPGADVRVQVTPREAQVYVDGYFVGIVDDFDGFSQRLRLVPGEHEIVVYLEGYRIIREKNLFRPGASYKIRYAMEKLAPGEPAPEKPRPAPDSERPSMDERRPPPDAPADAPPPLPPGPPGQDRGEPQVRVTEFGTLAIRVQPADAIVEIDDERWDSPSGGSRLLVEVSAGTHRVHIHKDGFRPYSTEVQVRSGEQTSLNVSLPPE